MSSANKIYEKCEMKNIFTHYYCFLYMAYEIFNEYESFQLLF